MKKTLTTNDPIGNMLDAMSPEELRAAARTAVVAHAWRSIDIEEVDSEHQDAANEAVDESLPDFFEEEVTAYVERERRRGLPEWVARPNAWRRFLNIIPMDENGDELDLPFQYEDESPDPNQPPLPELR